MGGSQGAGWGAISDSPWSAQLRAPPDSDALAKQCGGQTCFGRLMLQWVCSVTPSASAGPAARGLIQRHVGGARKGLQMCFKGRVQPRQPLSALGVFLIPASNFLSSFGSLHTCFPLRTQIREKVLKI